MKNIALVVTTAGIIISYLIISEGQIEAGHSMSSSILSGFYGFLQKDRKDKSYPEAILILCIFLLCVYSYFYDKSTFFSISPILNSAIAGFFGVSIGRLQPNHKKFVQPMSDENK